MEKKKVFMFNFVFLLLFSVFSINVNAEYNSNISSELLTDPYLSENNLPNENLITPQASPQRPSLQNSIASLAGKSTYVGRVSGAKQYHNRGNYNDGLVAMNKLGGKGETFPIINARGEITKWRKDGSDGTAMYYKSTSTTDGLNRWTITFPGYKIRFMGN